MGIRTPDLLHAMEQRSVHHSPLPFATDTADQPIRPPQSAAVQDSSLRMVTSLVTSHPGNAAPACKPPARYRPSARPDGACTEITPAGATPSRLSQRANPPGLTRTPANRIPGPQPSASDRRACTSPVPSRCSRPPAGSAHRPQRAGHRPHTDPGRIRPRGGKPPGAKRPGAKPPGAAGTRTPLRRWPARTGARPAYRRGSPRRPRPARHTAHAAAPRGQVPRPLAGNRTASCPDKADEPMTATAAVSPARPWARPIAAVTADEPARPVPAAGTGRSRSPPPPQARPCGPGCC